MKTILKPYRLCLHMSQTELASKIGVSKMSVSKIENNKCLPSWALIVTLAYALNMCPYHLIDFCVDCPYYDNCENKFF